MIEYLILEADAKTHVEAHIYICIYMYMHCHISMRIQKILIQYNFVLFQKCEQHLKWLLDPLPVDTRVVLSVQNKTCPSIWKYVE